MEKDYEIIMQKLNEIEAKLDRYINLSQKSANIVNNLPFKNRVDIFLSPMTVKERSISHGRQYHLSNGEIVILYDTGKIVMGGSLKEGLSVEPKLKEMATYKD